MITRDPVCGRYLDEETAPYSDEFCASTYYFCGTLCKESFSRNPDAYLGTDD